MEQTAVVVAGEAPTPSTDCDWTKLPAYLLLRIFGTLQIRDLFSSGGVCSSWRRSHLEARRLRLCSPHQSPCLVYSAADRDDSTATLHHLCTGKLCHVTIPGPAFRSRYVMGSSHGWLITADDRSHLILVNPITGAQVAMPPPETMHNVELRYGEEGRKPDGYDLIYADTVPHPKIEPYGLSLEQGRFCFYMVVAMSCDPSSENCVVVRVHMPKNLLSYARVGDTKWTWVDTHEECKSYVDVCYDSGDGLFYALRGCGDVHTIDLHGPSAVVNIVYKHKACYHTDSKYIVQAPWGDFFQIWRWDRYLEDDEEVVEDDDDNDVDEGVEELEMVVAEIEMEEDDHETESDVVSEDFDTETETEEDEEEVVEDDDDNDVDEGVEELEMVVAEIEMEEDDHETESDVVSEDFDTETETEEDEEEVVEDDNDNDVDEGVEELEMVVAEIEMEEDDHETESDVVSEDFDTETETEEDEEEVENADVSVEEEEEEDDQERTMEEDEEKERVTARFVVYKIDFVKQKLTRVHNLNDHTLFTGFNTSFLVPAKDFPTLIPNSIYHTDDLNHNTFSKRFSDRRALIDKGLRQVFIFNMEDSSFTNILAPNSSRLNCPPPVWILP